MKARLLATVATLAIALTAAAQDQGGDQAPAANPNDLKPRAAEMAPLAAKALILGLAAAGDRLVAVGDRGIILNSVNATDWEQVNCPVQAALTAVSFADANNGWAVGHDATVLHTADGGKTWQLQNYNPADHKPLLSVLALDAQHAIATGAYGLFLQTADGGKSWTNVDAPALIADGPHLNAIIKLKDGSLFIAGEAGLLGASADGKSWQKLKLPYEGSMFGALPRGDKGALVFGLRGNVFTTDDVRGNKWARIDTKTTQSMFGGAILPDGTIALAGADGEVLMIDKAGNIKKGRAGARDTRSLGSGTLSGVLSWKDGVLVAGEAGVARAGM